jgi:formiminoglutamase
VKIERGLDAWGGRVDVAEGDLALRWHQVVRSAGAGSSADGLSLIGLASDAGVRRNLGRPGAAQGPDAIRRQLSNLPVRHCRDIVDAGTVVVEDDELESGQEAYAGLVTAAIEAGRYPIGLGGGHEIALGSFQGLAAVLGKAEARPAIGILSLDSHFDIRAAGRSTSGTPFRQIAEFCAAAGWPFRYAVFGISPFANTDALYQRARALGVQWRQDDQMEAGDIPDTLCDVKAFMSSVDHLYLTICLDVLPASVAPGVSAPSAAGVALPIVERIVDAACMSGKLRVADVAELCPALDDDSRTARLAARLVGRMAEGWMAGVTVMQGLKGSAS